MTSYVMDSSEQLYGLLPEVYRTRDVERTGDVANDLHLKRYLQSFGAILDLVRHTLEQRYDDSFPDNSVPGHVCQDWIVPYFADLLAVSLYSPFPDGQRDEVANAVRWAQRKGSLQSVEEIAQAITQSEAKIQEGWKRVATTARIGMPLLPAIAMGEAEPMAPDAAAPATTNAATIARHPAIRAVTPDFRRMSRSVQAEPGTASAHQTRFGGSRYVWPRDDDAPPFEGAGRKPADEPVFWRQANPHGAPCFPGSYCDVSLRTVDVRTPDMRHGRHHPKRVILYLPPPYGLCAPDPYRFAWAADLSSALEGAAGPDAPTLANFVELEEPEDGPRIYRNKTAESVEIAGEVVLDDPDGFRFEKLRFADGIRIVQGPLALVRCAARALVSDAPAEPPNIGPLITLRDCLVETVMAPANTLQAEYVTVLGDLKAGRLFASDCIFAGTMHGIHGDADCVRFSRVTAEYFATMPPLARAEGVTAVPPEFFNATFCTPGCGVLRQTASRTLRNGAEDGGELGGHHDWHYSTRLDALAAKLKDHLPIGIEPVVIWDDLLLCKPPSPAA